MNRKSLACILAVLVVALLLPGLAACKTDTTGETTGTGNEGAAMVSILVDGERFIDTYGRERILHGVNMVSKDKTADYIGGWGRQDFEALRSMGFNLVRLGFIWDGIEPQPGQIDQTYLDKMEKLIDLCKEYGLYVIIDMHQDLYGSRYSDGAPAWATLIDGLPGPKPSEVWSDAYYSQAVERAFDHFWANDPASDGVGLQDHFAQCWKAIAERFGSRPEVLGYDFMNEPFPGSAGLPILSALVQSYVQVEASALGREPRSIEEAMGIFANKQKLFEALQLLDNAQRYKAFVQGAAELCSAFDAGILSRFYDRMAKAVRQVTPKGVLFMEDNYFGNIGVPSGTKPIAPDGTRDPLQAFAPHAYDFVVDSPQVGSGASNIRVGVTLETHRTTQQRLGVPVVMGEWGAFQTYSDIDQHALFLLNQFDSYKWSFTYWHWYNGETEANKLLTRVYPEAVAGTITSFSYNNETRSFEMTWQNDAHIKSPTLIRLPGGLAGRNVKVSAGCKWQVSNAGGIDELVITSAKNGTYTLTIS
jgi:endoglycosylceramidase